MNKPAEIKVYISFHNRKHILTSSFFSANKYILGGGKCCECGKKDLGKNDRVDVEFFGEDLESYCLDCWPRVILDKIIEERRQIKRVRAQYT